MENLEIAFGVIFVELPMQINAAGPRISAHQINRKIEDGNMGNTHSAMPGNPGSGNGLTDDERNICRLLNATEEEYIEARDAEITKAVSLNRSGMSSSGSLTADERKICEQLGVSEDDYLKTAAR